MRMDYVIDVIVCSSLRRRQFRCASMELDCSGERKKEKRNKLIREQNRLQQVRSENNASELDISGRSGIFWDILGQF